jgi:hypothetical protein
VIKSFLITSKAIRVVIERELRKVHKAKLNEFYMSGKISNKKLVLLNQLEKFDWSLAKAFIDKY